MPGVDLTLYRLSVAAQTDNLGRLLGSQCVCPRALVKWCEDVSRAMGDLADAIDKGEQNAPVDDRRMVYASDAASKARCLKSWELGARDPLLPAAPRPPACADVDRFGATIDAAEIALAGGVAWLDVIWDSRTGLERDKAAASEALKKYEHAHKAEQDARKWRR